MRAPIDGGTLLITGASAGIGRELARQLAPRAGALILLARRRDRLDALADELRALHPALKVHPVVCNLADGASIQAALAHIDELPGGVDVLINNAGIGEKWLFDQGDAARMEEIVRVNVSAVIRLTRHFVPAMVERGRGGVMNVGSGAGFTPMPGAATYVGSKYFINGFSQNLRVDLAGTGVVVTQVCPGPVGTEFNRAAGFERGRNAGWFDLTAEQCAREAIRGFDRGRFLVIPGAKFRLFMLALSLLPLPVKHRVLQKYSREMRSRLHPTTE